MALPETRIGQYVSRERVLVVGGTTRLEAITSAHRVESMIRDEPVTRCGRRLGRQRGTALHYEPTPTVLICKRCLPRG